MIEFAAMLFAPFENLGRRFTASTGARLPQNLGEQNLQVNRWDLLESRPAARSNACSNRLLLANWRVSPSASMIFSGNVILAILPRVQTRSASCIPFPCSSVGPFGCQMAV